MNLMQLKNASILFGQPPLIDKAELNVQRGERVCVVGRNGSGKSTLLKVLAGEVKLDEGQRVVPSNVVISRLAQDPPQDVSGDIFDYVAEGLEDLAQVLKDYHHITNVIADDPSDKNLNLMQSLQEQLDSRNAWQFEQRINNVLTQLNLPAEKTLSELSGGWRRKAALARAIVCQPDILLLDEPTNHLDIEMVLWLEKALLNYEGAIVFISHDRAFIRKLATRIIDIDRGQVVSYPGNYDTYLKQKAHDLDVEESHNREFDKKLAKEEIWIRQGIKARRTRNEGRVRALKKLRDEYKSRRNVTGNAVIQRNAGGQSGKRVFETENLSYSISGKNILSDLNLLITRGEKLALIGPNGCGKSTLIKLLLGELEQQEGELFRGTNLELAYFDQHRSSLELDKPVIDVIADGKREVSFNGGTRHVIGYLQDYLFAPDRVNAPVSTLSGGEKNRLMLAKLMLKPSNLLVLDEPTNDLDVETLELLESLLVEYQGTVLLVSHDREFVDNVVTSSIVFEGNGRIAQFVGGYSDMKAWYDAKDAEAKAIDQHRRANEDKPKTEPAQKTDKSMPSSSVKSVNKLSYKDKKELEALPKQIESMEEELELIQKKVNAPDFFQSDQDSVQKTLQSLADLEENLSAAYLRWDELESLQNNEQ
ncbi:ABC transporter ATP-binding protein [Glaciecola sp. MH2013]|uniref:ATP-binding cassette ATPase Uup n=1 Tax=Glaciecola sp. MH2013 TaxID=2785524 RepID=UPI0018A08BD0|nr:ABC transporter ATP-binding protein [Glaciecola sp. MH2013]MBF7072800.1 ABC transporter ATP-binding protein [Glaciecola sp. MH2013]